MTMIDVQEIRADRYAEIEALTNELKHEYQV